MSVVFLLAGVAIFVLVRLYSVIGKQKGAPPPSFQQPEAKTGQPKPVHIVPEPVSGSEEELAGGLEKIARDDPSFSQRDFLAGARKAYEMIVKAFADGDRGTLLTLLSKDVFADYDAAIEQREKSGEEPLELMRLKDANIEGGDMTGSVAEITVLFVAELTNGERISKTRELWTFERDLKSRDPNWRLADVSAS